MKADVSKEKRTADKIIAAATLLFARKGFAAVSVKEVADAAGVNIALISYYFGGKENLYTVVLNRQFAIVAELLDTIGKENLAPMDRIRRFAYSLVEVHRKAPFIDQLFYGEKMNPTRCFDTILMKEAARVHCFLRDCITEAIALGQFRPDLDVDFAALNLGGNIHYYFCTQPFNEALLPAQENQAEHYIEQALEIFFRGVLHSSQE